MSKPLKMHWEETITAEKGSYHNTHRNKYKENGIGMLEHNDSEKRQVLDEKVVSYLCKDDDKQEIESIQGDKKVKAFTRGTITKSKGNMGRPRQ